MPLQDLTPQLRTRLSRVERTVGWFITVATLLLLSAFAYYVYDTAQRKGWFETKVPYVTALNNASGLKVGEPVRLMGFAVGEITAITPNPPDAYYGITVDFRVKPNYYGYIWLDSKVRVASDFLGNRYLEILKGYEGAPTVIGENGKNLLILNLKAVDKESEALKKQIAQAHPELDPDALDKAVAAQLNLILHSETNRAAFYTGLANAEPYWLPPQEAPALSDRLEALVASVETALPNILALTNQLNAVLTNASGAAGQTRATMAQTEPLLANLAVITANLRDPHGSLGEWLLTTNLNLQLDKTLQSADATLDAAHATLADTDTNITALVVSLDRTLEQLALLTSNLNSQVEVNTNMLSQISGAVVHADELVQGLKRHWLLRSAFKNKPPAKPKK